MCPHQSSSPKPLGRREIVKELRCLQATDPNFEQTKGLLDTLNSEERSQHICTAGKLCTALGKLSSNKKVGIKARKRAQAFMWETVGSIPAPPAVTWWNWIMPGVALRTPPTTKELVWKCISIKILQEELCVPNLPHVTGERSRAHRTRTGGQGSFSEACGANGPHPTSVSIRIVAQSWEKWLGSRSQMSRFLEEHFQLLHHPFLPWTQWQQSKEVQSHNNKSTSRQSQSPAWLPIHARPGSHSQFCRFSALSPGFPGAPSEHLPSVTHLLALSTVEKKATTKRQMSVMCGQWSIWRVEESVHICSDIISCCVIQFPPQILRRKAMCVCGSLGPHITPRPPQWWALRKEASISALQGRIQLGKDWMFPEGTGVLLL